MSPERKKPLPEIPLGEELSQRVINSSTEALIKTYPLLMKLPYSDSLPSNNNVIYLPPEQIKETILNERKPQENKLYRLLKLCGLSEDSLENAVIGSNNNYIYRDKSSRILIHEGFLTEMHSDNPFFREQAYLSLGRMLITDTIQNAPISRTLPMDPWKSIAKQSLERDMFDALEEDQAENVSLAKLRIARNTGIETLNSKLKLVSQGASIYVIFPHQDKESSEFSFGRVFNQEIIDSLVEKPRIKYRNLMSDTFRLNGTPTIPQREGLSEAEKVCKSIGIMTSPNKLLEFYLDSTIPHFYLGADFKPRFNPYVYPS